MGGRRGGTRGVADGGWLGRLDGQKERKRGLAQPARPPLARGWTKPEERGVGVGFLAWHRGIDTLVGTQRHQRLRRPTSLHPNDRTVYPPSTRVLLRRLASIYAFSPPQLVQLPTHNPRMSSSRRANLIALMRVLRRAFRRRTREMPRNCLNCGTGTRSLTRSSRSATRRCGLCRENFMGRCRTSLAKQQRVPRGAR